MTGSSGVVILKVPAPSTGAALLNLSHISLP